MNKNAGRGEKRVISGINSVVFENEKSILVVLPQMLEEHLPEYRYQWEGYKFFYPKKMSRKLKNGNWEISYYSDFKVNVFKQEKNVISEKWETIDSQEIDMEQIAKFYVVYKKYIRELERLRKSSNND
ncbi:hypothetical protein [Mycoplasma zalophidermidis]|uniref:hypothetical protein n=1 Tax=Mycoplasma zalophidermidis TaxID=398174 RepID=UPI00215C4A85|nr:hypothetical protein [Mycoplasma zalophidermidis]MCR8966558.1 hypothetical protein [Mycoplasma zalophidermidis]